MRQRASGSRIIWLSGLILLIAIAGIVVMRSRSSMAAPLSWSKVWTAKFGGPAGAAVDKQQWTYTTGGGGYGNKEVEDMTSSPQNVHVNGSDELDITALLQGGTWTSGRIKSAAAFAPPAGGELEVTASIWQPDPANGLGYWPAFWLLGQGTWPAHGEIDILEDVNAIDAHSAHCTAETCLSIMPTARLGPAANTSASPAICCRAASVRTVSTLIA